MQRGHTSTHFKVINSQSHGVCLLLLLLWRTILNLKSIRRTIMTSSLHLSSVMTIFCQQNDDRQGTLLRMLISHLIIWKIILQKSMIYEKGQATKNETKFDRQHYTVVYRRLLLFFLLSKFDGNKFAIISVTLLCKCCDTPLAICESFSSLVIRFSLWTQGSLIRHQNRKIFLEERQFFKLQNAYIIDHQAAY